MTTFLGPRRRCSSRMILRGTLSSKAFVSFECSTATDRTLKRLSRESGACSLRTFFQLGSFQSFPTSEVLRKSSVGWRLACIYPAEMDKDAVRIADRYQASLRCFQGYPTRAYL